MAILEGKVAVVTGASRGIGKKTAELMMAAGAQVAICSRNLKTLEAAGNELSAGGARVFTHTADVTDRQSVDTFIAAVGQQFGRIDIVVNNAGESSQRKLDGVSWPVNAVDSVSQALPAGRFERIEDDEYREAIEQKLLGMVRVTRAALPWMRQAGGGSIVNITSIKGLQPPPRVVISGIAWAAAMNLSKSLSFELAADNIRVNVVSVGGILTPHMDESRQRWAPERTLQEFLAPRVANIPMKRLGTVEEVAQAIFFLASPLSSYTTGQIIATDGGGLRTI